MSKIAILGTGAWGSGLANVLLQNKHTVLMWGIDKEENNEIRKGTNKKYFGSKRFVNVPQLVTLDVNEILEKKPEYIILAIPSNFILPTLKMFVGKIKFKPVLINVAKGLDPKTDNIWSSSIKKMTSNNIKGLVTLIGPSFATEVFNQEPTIVNTISNNLKLSKQVSKLFNNHNFKCIEITDEVGAELIGALKNVMAIAMGIAYELHTSINTRAAMLAQATKEIYQVIKKFGGKAETLTQFCGIGDIYLTCTDTKSRNFAFGNLIAKYGFEKAKQMNKKTVEGIYASKIAYDIINKYKIDAPVLKEIYNVLFNKINHKNFVKDIIKKIIK